MKPLVLLLPCCSLLYMLKRAREIPATATEVGRAHGHLLLGARVMRHRTARALLALPAEKGATYGHESRIVYELARFPEGANAGAMKK